MYAESFNFCTFAIAVTAQHVQGEFFLFLNEKCHIKKNIFALVRPR